MGKPNGYEVVNPDAPKPESKQERNARERREKKFRDAAFAYTEEEAITRHERQRRHARFDDARRKGGRQAQRSRAIRDARDD